MNEDVIVDIPPERERFFGCSGKMLIPCPETVKALIDEIPDGRLITMNQMRAELARRKGVQVSCPPSTQKALKSVIADGNQSPWWRIVKANGELFAFFTGGIEGHAEHLAIEAFEIDLTLAKPKVRDYVNQLVHFD